MKRMALIMTLLVAAALSRPSSAQTAATPAAPAASGKAPGAAVDGCDRMKAHMDEMAGHMKRLAEGRGGHCGRHAAGGKEGGSGHCMRRMGEMMKELAPIADRCHAMTASHARHMARHEKEIARWKDDGAARK